MAVAGSPPKAECPATRQHPAKAQENVGPSARERPLPLGLSAQLASDGCDDESSSADEERQDGGAKPHNYRVLKTAGDDADEESGHQQDDQVTEAGQTDGTPLSWRCWLCSPSHVRTITPG